jgi:hypothetical protein
MSSVLTVPDEVVVAFFSAVVLGQSTAIVLLWRAVIECNADRARIWEKLNEHSK